MKASTQKWQEGIGVALTFGKSSEKLLPDQFNLSLEDAELAQGVLEAAQEKAKAALQRARGDAP